jgi:hypothetical protein
MHDEKYGVSGLGNSVATDGGLPPLNEAGRDNEVVEIPSPIVAHAVEVNVRSSVDVDFTHERSHVSSSQRPDDNDGRVAGILMGALLVALSIGFAGGLASYPFLNPHARPQEQPQLVNSSSHVRELSKSVVKADMLTTTTTAGGGSQPPSTIKPSALAVSQLGRVVPASAGTSQSRAAPPIAGKSPEPTSRAVQPELPEREAMVTPVPETKPTTIEGWTVREVRGEAIVLQGPHGIRKVVRGDMVAGVGRIDSVVRWGDRWIVATTSGLIATP